MSDRHDIGSNKNCVYELRFPSGYAYVGMTRRLKSRIRDHYRSHINNLVSDHMEENGYTKNDIEIHVIDNNLTRKEADKLETKTIKERVGNGTCLNCKKNLYYEKDFEVIMPSGEKKLI